MSRTVIYSDPLWGRHVKLPPSSLAAISEARHFTLRQWRSIPKLPPTRPPFKRTAVASAALYSLSAISAMSGL